MKKFAGALLPLLLLVAPRVEAAHLGRAALQTGSTATVTPSPTTTPTATATPTPTPGVTPTPTPIAAPSAAKLFKDAVAHLTSKNTLHLDYRLKLDLLGLIQGTLRVVGDEAIKQQTSFVHETGSLAAFGKAQKVDEYDIQVKTQSFTKSAKTHNRWQKQTASTQSMLASMSPSSQLISKTVKVSGLRTVGSQTFQHVAVWHVHAALTDTANKPYVLQGTVDFFISKKGHLLYGLNEYVNDTKDSILVDLHAKLSKFGEHLSIKAPTIGSAKP